MPSATASPVLSLAGFTWPWGPERVEVTVRPAEARRIHLEEPATGWSLWVDPTLPAPAKEGPLAAEAQALREVAGGGPLSHLALTLAGPHAPTPGVAVARRLATLAAVRGALPAATTPAQRAVLSGEPQPLSGEPVAVPADVRAWLGARIVLYRERVVENPPVHAPEPTPRLDPADPEAYWRAIAAAGLTDADSTRGRQRLEALAAAGLHAQWTLAAIRGRAVHLGLCPPERADDLRDALRAFSYEPLPCSLDASALTLDGGTDA